MDFEKWFIAQHGERESKLYIADLRADYEKKRYQSDRAGELLHNCSLWDEKYESALYAWNARSK
jgi:hypothetical protein